MRVQLTLILSLLLGSIFGQKPTYKDYFMEGSYLILENNVPRAQENFVKAYQLDSTNANINYMMGICFLQTKLEKSRAEYYLEKAVKNVSKHYRTDEPAETAAAPLAVFFYGEALHINYKFEEAIKQFEEFKKYVDPRDKEYLKMVTRSIATCKIAMDKVAHPINVQITNMGDSINSVYPEYGPCLSADERMIIFTTRRPNSTGGLRTEDDQYFEDVVVSYKDDGENWTKPVALSPNVNSIGHEATINMTPDGQTLIVYRNEPGGKNPEGNGNVYYSTYDGKDWSAIQDFGSDVNSEFMETHAALNSDGTILFFSSERPGGFGGKDIYRCIKLPNGKWSKALNMGPEINTENDEDGGFIHPDGQTFFYASNGSKSMGGFDIMFATLNEENKFINPINIGYPINTTDDDVFYVTSPDGKRGYFSSAKAGGHGNLDVYKATFAEARETFLALFKGQIVPSDGEKLPENLQIVVTDKTTNEIIGTYRPKMNGAFTTILPPGKEYNFSYQTDDGEEFYNEDVFVNSDAAYQEIKREVNLEPVRLGGKVRVKSKAIILNAVVLNSVKNKKPVPGVKLVLEDETGNKQYYDVNDQGRYEGIELQPDKNYSLYTEHNGKKSSVAKVTTMGAKNAKMITQVIYLEGKPEKFTSKELLLDIAVKHTKTKKPIALANINLTDEDGEKFEAVTDARGIIKGIELSPETRYEVMAHKESFASEVETFTTGGIIEAKRFEKVLYIAYQPSTALAKGTVTYEPGSFFEFYFNYGHRVINEADPAWIRFIDYLESRIKTNGTAFMSIYSSASRVPTRMKGGNEKLAGIRASNFAALLKKTLQARGVDPKLLKYKKHAIVSGPRYRGDWKIGRKKYQRHQYIKARIK
jgi:hypothetical protein